MVTTKVKLLENALNTAKLYLEQGITVTITPTNDGWFMIEKSLKRP